MDFFISDMHFGHSNLYRFTDKYGKPQRPFSQQECEELMVKNWNSAISDLDTVYILGDAVMDCVPRKTEEQTLGILRSRLSHIKKLNGRKILVLGNHDISRPELLNEHFDELHGSVEMHLGGFKCIITHIPVHTSQLKNKKGEGRFDFNIHGHLHGDEIVRDYKGEPDNRYINVNVENILYHPLSELVLCLRMKNLATK